MQQTQEAPRSGLGNLAEAAFLLLLFLLAACFSMLPVTRSLFHLWATDPLRSFGALLPLAAICLMALEWQRIGWKMGGAMWGLAPLALAIMLAQLSNGVFLAVDFSDYSVDPFQPGILLATFFTGVLTVLGGGRLLKQCLFPLALLVMVNPVPHFLSVGVDLPLQVASASVARSFAHALGLYPTGAQLQLMFTPRFGMQIVPGCNGMRGAATMAYAALLIAYVRRYRPAVTAAACLLAAVLGYLLNFLRLCCLVIYYAIGRNHPHLRGDGTLIDYIIGGGIFMVVSMLAGALWLNGSDAWVAKPERALPWPQTLRHRQVVIAAGLLVIAGALEMPSAYAALRTAPPGITPAQALAAMPPGDDTWHRSGTELEATGGTPQWMWQRYTDSLGRQVDLGFWMQPFQHYALYSWRIHGLRPIWQGSFTARAANNVPVAFATVVIRDDMSNVEGPPTLTFAAETTCLVDRCAEQSRGFATRGLAFAGGPLALQAKRRFSIMLRVQHPGQTDVDAPTRAQDEEAMADLLGHLDTRAVVEKFGYR